MPANRSPLIICATLVQNPINLGGLCRTCEVFRLEALVLADLAIASHPGFRGAAASAHHWQPIRDCAIADLPDWLISQRQQGYRLITLDAKPAALPLTEFQFPEKSVLLLGQELTGIPKPLISLCDRTVTIPQFGVVESLNVQVAAAIAIYEYRRQHQLD